ARYVPLPSLAYRLALAAIGEGIAAPSWPREEGPAARRAPLTAARGLRREGGGRAPRRGPPAGAGPGGGGPGAPPPPRPPPPRPAQPVTLSAGASQRPSRHRCGRAGAGSGLPARPGGW